MEMTMSVEIDPVRRYRVAICNDRKRSVGLYVQVSNTTASKH
jgi:hypothetical protein